MLRAPPTPVDAVVAEAVTRPTGIGMAAGVAVDKQPIAAEGEDAVERQGGSHALNAESRDTLQMLVRNGSVHGSVSNLSNAGHSRETYYNESW